MHARKHKAIFDEQEELLFCSKVSVKLKGGPSNLFFLAIPALKLQKVVGAALGGPWWCGNANLVGDSQGVWREGGRDTFEGPLSYGLVPGSGVPPHKTRGYLDVGGSVSDWVSVDAGCSVMWWYRYLYLGVWRRGRGWYTCACHGVGSGRGNRLLP